MLPVKQSLLLSSVIGCLMLLPIASAHAAFSDVSSSHPYAEAIEYAQSTGIVHGYADGTFRPDQKINRAEFTKIIEESIPAAAEGVGLCPPDLHDAALFPDVSANDWFALPVCMAKGRGVIQGYPDGRFHPADPINFVEAAKIIFQANHLDVRGIVQKGTESSRPWYAEYVQYLEKENALPATIGSFDQYLTRGEMVQMIYGVNHRTETEEKCHTNPVLACARDAQRRAHIQQIAGAVANYYEIYGKLPIELHESSLAICTMEAIQGGICTGPVADLSFLVKAGLMDDIPVDPSFAAGTKHTGYEIFQHDNFMGIWALQREMAKSLSALIMFRE